MKRQFFKKLHPNYRVSLKDLVLIIVPALLWFGATHSRSVFIQPPCTKAPQTCSKESVLPIDRLSIGMEDSQADEYSYFGQNISGAIAYTTPILWNAALLGLGGLTPTGAALALGVDLTIVLQTTVWNGLFTEVSHLISQRPRPFVYMDPVNRGIDPSHYTSFYSGHTSFAAAANWATFLILFARGAPFFLLILSAVVGYGLTFSTAYFRILAGRHFLTDVICGAIAGTLVAWLVIHYHHRRSTKYDVPELEA